MILHEAKERRGLRAPWLVHATGPSATRAARRRPAGTDRVHCRCSENAERRVCSPLARGAPPPHCRRHRSHASSRGRLTVLAADERVTESRCARDDVTARSRSWRQADCAEICLFRLAGTYPRERRRLTGRAPDPVLTARRTESSARDSIGRSCRRNRSAIDPRLATRRTPPTCRPGQSVRPSGDRAGRSGRPPRQRSTGSPRSGTRSGNRVGRADSLREPAGDLSHIELDRIGVAR